MRPQPSHSKLEDLWQRMVLLEDNAYREFSDLFGWRFRSFFMSRGVPMAEAEDLAVDCVTDVALKVNRYDPEKGRFGAWVYTLARHALADWWRRHRTSLPLSDETAAAEYQRDSIAEEPTERQTDIVDAVREAMAQIPEHDQILVRMRELESDQPYSAIAKRLGIRTGTARVRHHRALRRLKTILGKDPRIQPLLEHHQPRVRRHAV